MSALLHMSDVAKSYARGSSRVRVLEQADLALMAGEFVGVIGSRGQGKTTLLRIAAGMESPDHGEVRFDGVDLRRLSDAGLSRMLGDQIAWAGTRGPAMPMRMLDYVAMPLLAGESWRRRRRGGVAAQAIAHDALERVGALACAGRRWESMSDWERALAELAQAIAGRPRLLLIDDLTDTLGIRETDELTSLLRQLGRELTMAILMGVSDAQAALLCDRMVTLIDGRLCGWPHPRGGEVIDFPTAGSASRRIEHSGV